MKAKIVDISKEDAFYDELSELKGKRGRFEERKGGNHPEGFQCGNFYFDDDTTDLTFFGVKVEPVSEKATTDNFYFVAKDDRNTFVSFRHATEESATQEALRLAEQEHTNFYVLKAIKKVTVIQNSTVTSLG